MPTVGTKGKAEAEGTLPGGMNEPFHGERSLPGMQGTMGRAVVLPELGMSRTEASSPLKEPTVLAAEGL